MSPEIRRPGPSRSVGTPPPRPSAPDRPAEALLGSLESLGARPALAWLGETGRVELSGHVLANWIIKTIHHLDAEVALAPGELVVLAMPPHWKRLVIAVAAWSLGARVQLGDVEDHAEIRILVTDRPEESPADDADEVLALDAVSLSMSFSGPVPALAHDWIREVRSQADQLSVPLPAWSGPEVVPALDDGTPTPGERDQVRPLRLRTDGVEEAESVLAALLVGRGLVGPEDSIPPFPGTSGPEPARGRRSRS